MLCLLVTFCLIRRDHLHISSNLFLQSDLLRSSKLLVRKINLSSYFRDKSSKSKKLQEIMPRKQMWIFFYKASQGYFPRSQATRASLQTHALSDWSFPYIGKDNSSACPMGHQANTQSPAHGPKQYPNGARKFPLPSSSCSCILCFPSSEISLEMLICT